MPDPGNPDQDPKPGKPEPGKGAFGWYKPPTEPSRKLNEGDDQPHQDQAPATDQETLFRAAAIKCAQMEEELAELMKDKLNGKDYTQMKKRVYFLNKIGTVTKLSSYVEDIKGVEGGQLGGISHVTFIDDVANHVEQLGINTNRQLAIGLHTDDLTRKEYGEYSKKDPIKASNAWTGYYFTLDGEYKKSVTMTREGIQPDPNRKPIGGNGSIITYESKMTAGDFELAGQALMMLKKRVIDPNWDQKPAE